jgi:type 1 glutamine amidotransferase
MSDMDQTGPPQRVDGYLVSGGNYHDFDYARLRLLDKLAAHDHVRVAVGNDYSDIEGITAASFLVSYTCDIRPTAEQQEAIAAWIRGGGRWLALHGTNAILDKSDHGFVAPREFPIWMETLGSQFIAHPPIAPYTVELASPDHPLVAGIEPFDTDDELYLMELHDEGSLEPLLHTQYAGDARGFAQADWSDADRHLVSYIRRYGEGAVLYNTLGHCRGHWDMEPIVAYYPTVERCSWELPAYHELLRRGLSWCLRDL